MSRADPRWRLSPAIIEPFRELGDLKRIRSAGRAGSVAARRFRVGWGALVAGAEAEAAMLESLAACLPAARLGDLDRETLSGLGLSAQDATAVLGRATAEMGREFDAGVVERVREALTAPALPQAAPPRFVDALAEQPRAGVTCPGRPRRMLEPAENHAEHCLVVALYAALLAPAFGAEPGRAWLLGMTHHLHSAAMPDSGYTGEILLGDKLDGVIEAARAQALGELAGPLRDACAAALAEVADDATPAAKAFHAADAIDRVLEIESHLLRGALTMRAVMDEYGLVHDGPVKAFHDRVLAEVGLA